LGNHQKTKQDPITSLLESDSFLDLDPAIQKQIICSINQSKDKTGGIMGKLLGNKPANLAIHAILILCLILLLLILIDNLYAYRTGTAINMELINIIIPVITLAIGYIIGKGTNDNC